MAKLPGTTGDHQLWIWSVALMLFGAGLFLLRAGIGDRYFLGGFAALAVMVGAVLGVIQLERSKGRPSQGGSPP